MKTVKNIRIMLSLSVLGIMLLIAVLGPVLSAHDPLKMNRGARLQASSSTYWLGTDEYGRDVLSRLALGMRVSFGIAVGGVLVAFVLGSPFGIMAALLGRTADVLIMRTVDILLSFPPIVIAMAVMTILQPSPVNVVLVIALLYTPKVVRVAHGAALTVKEQDFIMASVAVGVGNVRLLWKHLFPNCMSPLLVQFSLNLAFAILLESGLSFLGLGPPPPAPSLGRMVAAARPYMAADVTLILIPSIVIAATTLALNILGDALRDELDPRLQT